MGVEQARELPDAASVLASGDAAPTPDLFATPTPPKTVETCGNGRDDDGDTFIDEGCACVAGKTQTCFNGRADVAGIGACRLGIQTCQAGGTGEFKDPAWGPCQGDGTPQAEACNDGIDNDCDGAIDNGCPCKDGETMACAGACGAGTQTCMAGHFGPCSARAPGVEVCNGIDDDCDGKVDGMSESCATTCGAGVRTCTAGQWSACPVKAPAAEVCNGIDDDCDGKVDGMTRACSSTCGSAVQTCNAGQWSACPVRAPVAETCNGVDDDCDGRIDGMTQSCSNACGTGVQTCSSGQWSACPVRTPTAEICNLADDNCNGQIDEGLKATWSFKNLCRSARVFVVTGGCNVCRGTCNGYWVDPGTSLDLPIAQNTCFTWSAFVRASTDICLTENDTGVYIGETRQLCNGDCKPQVFTMQVRGGC